jgi:hypothetical protein
MSALPSTIRRLLRALARDRRGALVVEVALAIPVLAGLLLSGVEVTRYVLLNQKLERASATMADLVSQAEKISEADLANLFIATRYTVEPFDLAGDGRVIVSSIAKSSGTAPRVVWQRAFGSGSGTSSFGVQGGDAVLPDGFAVRDGENVIVGEAFFDFVPVFAGDALGNTTLHSYAVLRPRFGSLTSLN